MIRHCAILLGSLLIAYVCLAQENLPDTARINTLLLKANSFAEKAGSAAVDLDSALLFIGQAEDICARRSVAEKWRLHCMRYRGLIYLEKSQWDSAKKVLLPLADAYGKLGEKMSQALCYELYGGYLNIGEAGLEIRSDMFSRALTLYRSIHAQNKAIHMARSLAGIHHLLHKSDLAVTELLSLAEECKQLKTPYITYVYNMLLSIEQSRGNYSLALGYGLASIKAGEQFKEKDKTNDYFQAVDIARLYYVLDNYEEGVNWHLKGHVYCKQYYPQFVYYDFATLIVGMIKIGRAGEALQMVQQTEKEFPPQDAMGHQAIALCKALCYHAFKQYKLAETFFMKAEAVVPQMSNLILIEYNAMARFYLDLGAFSKARKYAQSVLDLPDTNLSAGEKSNTYFLLFKADSALGNLKSALHYLSLHKALSDSIFTDRKEKQTRELLVQYETEKKEKDLRLNAQRIDLLKKNADVQTLQLGKVTANRNLALWIAGLLVVITILLLNQYRLNSRNTRVVRSKNNELEALVKDKDRLLDEKEWLLKEVHHRVKNNLQTVLSLLESQSRHLKNEALSAIQDSQNRVYAMSLIHKKLYHSKDVTMVNMDSYLRELVENLRNCLNGERRVLFSLEVDGIELDVCQAVPIGLIINEAVTNSIKYAFEEGSGKHLIAVSMKQGNNKDVVLTVSDNGKGFDVNGLQANRTEGGLGLKLMRGLAEDIEGQFSIVSENGVQVTVVFTAIIPLHKVNEAIL